ncbi:photosynthetic complex putative assembly protein PuhB [Glacieibacterium frigidum]|uniref:PH domain-containing protein n=1 Tax=Glacieibacterium frigidum TaxID=2593303 RepID=A0A552U9U7_9SPHN|nr:photosynthetic complex putative assembly protein PuhB [Glacieibacterium frigidum]TRW14993.1 PH domain-containing protein [Glacieibacterium frigidum]
MNEYGHEEVRGLPGRLPPGETLLWQGSPDWRRLARDAFHTYLVAAYFGVLLVWAVIDAVSPGGAASPIGIAATGAVAVAGLGLLYGLAWLSARTTVYSITSKRVVLRFGIALPKCVNLPFAQVGDARLAVNKDGTGDIALAMTAKVLGYAALWPHARPWQLAKPEPMMRALPDVASVAALLADACAKAVPGGRRLAVTEDVADFGPAVAA